METASEVLKETLTTIGFLFGMIIPFFAILIYLLIKIRVKKMTRIPIIVEDRKNYESISTALNGATAILESHGIIVPDSILDANRYTSKRIKKLKEMNILALSSAVNDNLVKIITEVKSALADGKISLKDLDEGISIGSALSKIGSKYSEMKGEITDLTWEEAEILMLISMRSARKAKGIVNTRGANNTRSAK